MKEEEEKFGVKGLLKKIKIQEYIIFMFIFIQNVYDLMVLLEFGRAVMEKEEEYFKYYIMKEVKGFEI